MQPRPRTLTLLGAVTAAIATGPILGSSALAGEPIVVEAGDTLSDLALRHGVEVEELVHLNGIADPNLIFPGQRLRLEPAATAAAPAAQPAATHVVRAGEHLTGIARHYGTTVAAIASANAIANPSRIYAGQRLVIRGAAPAVAPAAPGAPAAGSLPNSIAAAMARRDDVRRMIVEEANRFGVPPAFALAVAWQESGWQQGAVSSAGAVGVMQLLPTTGEWVGAVMLGSPVNIHDARQNVRAGVRLLAHYLARYDGNRELTLAAYYQGQSATDRHGVYPTSRVYVASILALAALLEG
jgi:soluble lytic murein transglycosylase-like protein